MALNPYDPNVIRPGDTVLTEGAITIIRSAYSVGTPLQYDAQIRTALERTFHEIFRRRARLTTARHQRRNAARRHR